ncbi:MAG: homoserine dehydrogenase [Amylibacter sp.]|nr:homoserine dehydrogenase [Amylibacter sp.]
MSNRLRLGIAGLGTVGVGVIKIIQQNAALLQARSGRMITISAVSARSKTKNRDVDVSGYAWEDDPVALAKRGDVDVVLELIGGDSGPAKAAVEAAITAGKHVVTANKAMLALHGQELALQAEAAGVNLRFEAAVAGAIPVIKVLTESLAANNITRVMGVMNGTCNYILTRMESAKLPYDVVFEEANKLGYLEADPNLDVGGIDAANILAGMITNKDSFGKAFNIASGGRETLNNLYKEISNGLHKKIEELKIKEPIYKEFRAGDIRHSNANISEAKKLLGYQPTHNLQEGLSESLEWYINDIRGNKLC